MRGEKKQKLLPIELKTLHTTVQRFKFKKKIEEFTTKAKSGKD
jgi:hypothetical protein